MNGNVQRNAKTAFVCVLFIIIVSLFFYLLTAGTMPKYVDIPSADKIADDKIVQTHGECHESAGNDAGHDLVNDDLGERLDGCICRTILQKATYHRAIPMINTPHSA